MTTTTLSSREFNQDTSRAKKAATKGPVIITDRGKPAHVLLTFDQYRELSGKKKTIVELLSMPGMPDIEFDPPRLGTELVQPADLSD
jgi:prevent-host-death family protein